MDDLSKSYQLLGLQPGATPEEARQAYRDMVNVWHPDRFEHDERLRQIAQNKLKEINGAYEVIKASFFEPRIAPEEAASDETGAAPADFDAQPPARASRSAALWTVVGLVALSLIVATIWIVRMKSRDASPTSSLQSLPEPSHYALACNPGGRVEISTTGSLSGTFTVECWASTRRPGGTGTILCSRGPKDFTFDIKFRQGKRFHGDIGDGSRWLARMANARFNYNSDIWYHIAYVVTPTNHSIYVNGELRDDTEIYPPGNPLLYDADHRLCLGADVLEPADLDGSIAELRIWRTARTADQIKANMNKVLIGDQTGLRGYWRLNEGTGRGISDSSGHGFTGTLIGNVTWTTNTPPIVARSK